MITHLRSCLAALAMVSITCTVQAAPDTVVIGQKLDSGLGSLPHYSKWADPTGRTPMSSRVVGESLDDGLGALPHYSRWLDRSGRDPMGRIGTAVAQIQR